ncbi:hypothetical protein F4802DRAFT_601133 [Xylaria palmicola]|nr:hypothetical protein F4802DRAFT_601133 [Xylaria palmicola]
MPQHDDLRDSYAISNTIDFALINEDTSEIDDLESQMKSETRALLQGLTHAVSKATSKQIATREAAYNSDRDANYNGNKYPPEYYRAGVKEIDGLEYIAKTYFPKTERQTCCSRNCVCLNWKSVLQHLTIGIIYKFFEWHLHQKTGKSGKRKRKITKQKSLAFVKLGAKNGLRHDTRINRCMSVEDLKKQITTTLCTSEKAYKLGEIRILAVLFLLLLAPAGARPTSILLLRYQDIEITLIRDPKASGVHKLVIKFTLGFTKQYLGPKAVRTFPVPEILCEDNFLMSPYIFLLAVLFRHDAFASRLLSDNPHQLPRLRVHQVDIMSHNIKQIRQLTGFEHDTICYTLQYSAGNNMDQSVHVSEDMRNAVMGHSHNSDTFQERYLTRQIPIDLNAIQRGLDPAQELMHLTTSHGHSWDTRRKPGLTLAQTEAMMRDPKLLAMKGDIDKLPVRSEERRAARRQYNRHLSRLRTATTKAANAPWTTNQSLNDVDWQIQGNDIDDPAYIGTPDAGRTPLHPAHQRMIDAILAPDDTSSLDAYFRKRCNAIDAVKAYYVVDKPLKTNVLAKANFAPVIQTSGSNWDNVVNDMRRSVIIASVGERLTRCNAILFHARYHDIIPIITSYSFARISEG